MYRINSEKYIRAEKVESMDYPKNSQSLKSLLADSQFKEMLKLAAVVFHYVFRNT